MCLACQMAMSEMMAGDGRAAAKLVTNHTALLTELDWNGGRDGPAIISYSFETTPQAAVESRAPGEVTSSFRAMSEADKALARAAFAEWGKASGLIFVEADSGRGDIRLGTYNLQSVETDLIGFAFYPQVSTGPSGASVGGMGGDVYLDRARFEALDRVERFGILAHEIGHALGFKHPFEGAVQLSPGLDNQTNTVMSYTGDFAGLKLGRFDIAAAAQIYGAHGSETTQFRSWNWDSRSDTLTLIGQETSNLLRGAGGWNTIEGRGGNDTILGNTRSDRLDGGRGDDVLFGAEGGDTFVIRGNEALNDRIYGDSGYDTLLLASKATFSSFSASGARIKDVEFPRVNHTHHCNQRPSGRDRIDLSGFLSFKDAALAGLTGDDILTGGNRADVILGGEGNDG